MKGEVKVEPHTTDPKRFLSLKKVFIEGGETPVKILHCREHRGDVFLCLENVADRTAAESLRNKKLFVDKADRMKLPEGHYFIEDILGAEICADGKILGKLFEVLQYGAADVFRAKGESGAFMFPNIKSVVLDIDAKAKKITVSEEELAKVVVYEE